MRCDGPHFRMRRPGSPERDSPRPCLGGRRLQCKSCREPLDLDPPGRQPKSVFSITCVMALPPGVGPSVCSREGAKRRPPMTITLPELIFLVLIAAVVGTIGRQIAGGTRGGLLVSIVVGFVGAL